MPAVRHVYQGANFAASGLGRSARLTEHRTDLVGEYLFGRDVNTSVPNLANPDLPLIVHGTPTFDARAATLAQANWFDTQILDSQELTLLTVVALAGATAPLITNYDGANVTAVTSLHVSSNSIQGLACGTDNAQQVLSSRSMATPTTDFRIICMRTTGAANFVGRIDQFKAGVREGGTTTNSTKTRKVVTDKAFAIGSSRGSNGFAGATTVAAAAIWHGYLSDADLLAVAQEITAGLDAVGIDC